MAPSMRCNNAWMEKNNWWLIWQQGLCNANVDKRNWWLINRNTNSDKMEWIQKWFWFLEAFSTKVRLQVQERGHRVEGRGEQVNQGTSLTYVHIWKSRKCSWKCLCVIRVSVNAWEYLHDRMKLQEGLKAAALAEPDKPEKVFKPFLSLVLILSVIMSLLMLVSMLVRWNGRLGQREARSMFLRNQKPR